jgi:hypothetical protein
MLVASPVVLFSIEEDLIVLSVSGEAEKIQGNTVMQAVPAYIRTSNTYRLRVYNRYNYANFLGRKIKYEILRLPQLRTK